MKLQKINYDNEFIEKLDIFAIIAKEGKGRSIL